ncbi:hypothetical protein [Arcobacter roscoffensis]|uniref:DUF3971 domain-containing protein n=1 Tax=Arcobacter roscoffensis TaxID=2961520 RepID=A0ABY5E3X0_9BACT|nr:hypothetical protein [Arcobacter roscoffensis]UTJ05763.1 hypothetical protein NJU99_10925 [Arcobacter roscoffensis]
MKKILKSLVYVIFFIFISMVLLPKQELFYFLEKKIEEKNIVISNEQFENKILGFDLKYSDIYFEQINVANVEKLSINTYLFYNQVSIKNVRLLDSFKSMFPTPLTNIYLTYSILDYENVQIEADGIFGKLYGSINIFDRKAIVYLEATSSMKNSYSNVLRQMKFKDGRYVYEYKF